MKIYVVKSDITFLLYRSHIMGTHCMMGTELLHHVMNGMYDGGERIKREIRKSDDTEQKRRKCNEKRVDEINEPEMMKGDDKEEKEKKT